MPYKYRYRPPVFARVQSAKVVPPTLPPLFIILDFYLVSMRFLFSRYVYYFEGRTVNFFFLLHR